MAEACGTAYYRYGAALLYRAQEEQDVFGDDMKSAAQERDIQVRLSGSFFENWGTTP